MTDYPQATPDITEAVKAILENHKGKSNAIKRETLTFAVFRKVSKSYDRKLRDALSQLPVVWDDGYFVPTSMKEAERYLSSNRSRQVQLGKKNWIVERYLRQQAESVQVEQLELLEV